MAFVDCLVDQTGRGDPVGDLSEEWKADLKFSWRVNLAELRSHPAQYGDPIEQAPKAARRECRALA